MGRVVLNCVGGVLCRTSPVVQRVGKHHHDSSLQTLPSFPTVSYKSKKLPRLCARLKMKTL
eukprot:898428-Rhodomonas_salina.1